MNVYHCEKCHYKTTFPSKWELHCNTDKHKIDKVKYHCDKCNFTTSFPSIWEAHCDTKKHNTDKQIFHCDKCNYDTDYESSWKVHLNSKKHNTIIYRCDFCDIHFKTEKELLKHEKTNTHKDIVRDKLYNDAVNKWEEYHRKKSLGEPIDEPTDKDRKRLSAYGERKWESSV